jgi:two-component system CheB/CheR fusion protein
MTTISRRIERRMSILQLTDTRDYVRYLENNIGEVDALFKELLIGVTSFFRDLEAFQVLEKTAIPEMLKKKPDGSIIRVWVPGCSTGEEAYSLAILLAESLGHRKDKVQIFATDIDRDAIDVARKGDYPDNIIADVSRERLKKFFVTEEDGHYKVKKEIRDMIVFAEQDVISDPPFTNMEIVSCRNLLIYLQPDVQNKILLLFLYALNPGGILFLGPSESVGQLNTAFAVIDNKWKIYRRQTYLSKKDMAATLPIAVSSPVERANIHVMKTEPAIANMAQSILLEYFSPPAVLINANGDIVYVNGHTGKYLEVAPGKAAMNVFTMARKGLAADLSIAVKRAEKEKKEVVLKGLEVHTNGDKQAINLLVKPIIYPEALKNYMLVVFQDVEVKKHRVGEGETITLDRCKEVSEELLYTKQRLQTTQEEMSASQEELRSLNEELQSTNEELQSTNEELTTSKEELQSLNEELVTVNSELQAKIDDLTRTSNDMNNLLNSTEIATIFLDNHLKIMRYTPSATKVVNIIQGDIGRPFTDISSVIDDEIVNDAKKVADDLTPVEREIRIKDGRWFNLRIIPYRTTENVIAGVVLTFNDITGLKRLEGSLIAARNYANNIIATIREPLIVLDSDMKVISANQSFFRDFKETPADTIGQDFFELDGGQWNIPELKKALKEVLPLEKEIEDFKVDYDFPKVGHKVILLNARVIESEDNKGLILLAFENMCHDGE